MPKNQSGSNSSRIKFAFYSTTWNYETGKREDLASSGTKVLPSDYEDAMDGHLFCPGCFTNVFRTPRNRPVFTNGRKACFAHYPRYRDIECDLRSTKPEGKHYTSEEEAKQAISAKELVIINAFRKSPPTIQDATKNVYDQSSVEDLDGPLADISISRHKGDIFRLPTKFTTVNSICRNFDQNLFRYYVFPGTTAAVRLVDGIRSVISAEAVDDVPRLYFGRIESSRNAGKSRNNIRMTWLEHARSIKDFCIKDTDLAQQDKGISDDSKGRIVLVWGCISVNGIGLCFTQLGWGEYALLPQRYNSLLDD
jgi:hypothetical protein